MFLVAMARPQWDAHTFKVDGKVGIWPFVKMHAAQRTSRNRPRGTMEYHCVSVIKEVYKAYILEKVLPAIAEKCPASMRARQIRVQQDNAKPHNSVNDDDADIIAKLQELNLTLTFVNQPANSPDLNVLDLAFFRAIQSLQQKTQLMNKAQLIDNTLQAYNDFPDRKIDNGFLTLMGCMNMILENDRDNKYRIPHMSKASLEKSGTLPWLILISTATNILEMGVEEMEAEVVVEEVVEN